MKVLWALNPFDSKIHLIKMGTQVLKSLFPVQSKIEAVYVASTTEPHLSTAFDVEKEDRFSKYPKNLLERLLKSAKAPFRKIHILKDFEFSLTHHTEMIAKFAKREDFDLILVAAQTKGKWNRFFMGSFSETLVHNSRSHILVYHGHTLKKLKRAKRILFAHDFSLKGDRGLEILLKICRTQKLILDVLHVPEPAFGMNFDTIDLSLADYRVNTSQKAQKIQKLLQSKGNKGEVHVNSELKPVSEIILRVAKKLSSDAIVFAAHSDPQLSMAGGNVTRQILRKSGVPTLILKT